MSEFFNNASVSAFCGALFAFLLVALNDYRRSRRQLRVLSGMLEDNRNHAERKLSAVKTNIALLKEDNKISGAPFMRFTCDSVLEQKRLVTDILSNERKQAVDALVFWMSAIDSLLDDATRAAQNIRLLVQESASIEQKDRACTAYLELMGDVEKNLGHLLRLLNAYLSDRVEEILNFEHEMA